MKILVKICEEMWTAESAALNICIDSEAAFYLLSSAAYYSCREHSMKSIQKKMGDKNACRGAHNKGGGLIFNRVLGTWTKKQCGKFN